MKTKTMKTITSRLLLSHTIAFGLILLAGPSAGHAQTLIAGYQFNPGTTPVNVVTGNVGPFQYGSLGISTLKPITNGNNSLRAGDINGNLGYVQLPADQVLATNRNYTLSFWLRPTSQLLTNSGMLMSIGHDLYGIRIGVNSAGRLIYREGQYSSGNFSAPLTADTWVHVALRYSWAGTSGGTEFGFTDGFINGVMVFQRWGYGWYREAWDARGSLGYAPPISGASWDKSWGSLINDVRYYNAWIPNSQIQSDMNTPVPEPTVMGLLGISLGAVLLRRSRRRGGR